MYRNWWGDDPEEDWERYNERTGHRAVDEYHFEEPEPIDDDLETVEKWLKEQKGA